MATYINGRIKSINGKYGTFLSCSFKLSELGKHVNEKGYINFTINERKEAGKYGETHYAILNDYTPGQKQNTLDDDETFGDAPAPKKPAKKVDDEMLDIPF